MNRSPHLGTPIHPVSRQLYRFRLCGGLTGGTGILNCTHRCSGVLRPSADERALPRRSCDLTRANRFCRDRSIHEQLQRQKPGKQRNRCRSDGPPARGQRHAGDGEAENEGQGQEEPGQHSGREILPYVEKAPQTEHHVGNSRSEGERAGTKLTDRKPDDGDQDQSPGQVQRQTAPHLSSSLDGGSRGGADAADHDAADHAYQYRRTMHELPDRRVP